MRLAGSKGSILFLDLAFFMNLTPEFSGFAVYGECLARRPARHMALSYFTFH